MEGTTLPREPGRDFAGVIVEGPPNRRGMEVWGTGGDMGFTRDGSHAEYIAMPASAAVPKPPHLCFEDAACAGLNFVTAYEGLVTRANIKPAETLLVTGAQGGVGSAAMQLGQAFGAQLISVDRKPLDSAAAIASGLLGHIDSSQEDLTESARRLASGKGVDVAIDCVGGALFEPVLATLSPVGRQIAITSVGQRRVSFDLLVFCHRRLTLLGVDSLALTVSDCAMLLQAMSPHFTAGRLKPAKISQHGSLADAQQLYSYVDDGGAGKAVFVFRRTSPGSNFIRFFKLVSNAHDCALFGRSPGLPGASRLRATLGGSRTFLRRAAEVSPRRGFWVAAGKFSAALRERS